MASRFRGMTAMPWNEADNKKNAPDTPNIFIGPPKCAKINQGNHLDSAFFAALHTI
jgi:hypothetical protein